MTHAKAIEHLMNAVIKLDKRVRDLEAALAKKQ